ncbi:MAG: hypothetical protein Q7U82_06610 [Gammaproteobacteria bacterium]|nr:hypothetical protein [Gammaproteobacteria bacterium]
MRVSALFSAALLGVCASSSLFAQSTQELIAQAIRPLPEDLRAEATVFRYDPTSGERIVLRQGSNHVECRPKDEEGFTRCTPTATASRSDLSSRLRAQGLSDEDVNAALAEAERKGEINARIFGSISYRLYDEPDRIQLLWILSVPNATPEQLGMPIGSQRSNAIAGKGTPWMMEPGTPSAHLMIPINGTELSNKPQ